MPRRFFLLFLKDVVVGTNVVAVQRNLVKPTEQYKLVVI